MPGRFSLTVLTTLISTCSFAASHSPPEALVAPSAFKGVHGLAVDQQGRLLAGSVVGNSIYQVDIETGQVSTFIGPDQGQADDIAIGPRGEMAWTGFYTGEVLYRETDQAPIRVLADGLPGINSIAFNQDTGALYASQVFLGDALWEIDINAQQPPRLIGKDLGGFNGFEVGQDGWLYGPLWFKGQVVRIDPASAKQDVVADGFGTPAAVNFDSKGNLYVVDTLTGQLLRIDNESRQVSTVAQLASSLDNLAIDEQDRIFVSNMADNSIQQVNPNTGESRVITQGDLAVPAGLSLSEDAKTLYISDIFAFRAVNTETGQVRDIRRAHGSDVEYPTAVGLGQKQLLLTSFATGTLQILDRSDYSTLAMIHGLNAPSAAVELEPGRVVVSEMGAGTLVILSGEQWQERQLLAQGLQGPVQMIRGQDGMLYLTEAAGFLTQVDPSSGQITRLAQDLLMPEGLAQQADGQFIIAETAAQRLTLVNPANGERRVLAENLPIGFPAGPGMPPSGVPTGVAVDNNGVIYFGSDIDNGLYRIKPEH